MAISCQGQAHTYTHTLIGGKQADLLKQIVATITTLSHTHVYYTRTHIHIHTHTHTHTDTQ